MPSLRSFRGIRYAATRDLADLVCPPYDVISPRDQERLYAKHPHNAVRLELARGGPDYYADAAATFRRWRSEGILVDDPTPSLYVYRQDFETPQGRRAAVAGVIGALELEEFGDTSGVLPHERTMAGPKADRLALMRALPANVSPIYAIYRGGGAIAPFLGSLENRPPQARLVDEEGILHRLWVIAPPAEVQMLSDALTEGPLVIADGHHRYETALEHHRERDGQGPHSSIMCLCVDADAEDLVVLPYNRLLKVGFDEARLNETLKRTFRTIPLDADELVQGFQRSASDHALVFVLPHTQLVVEVSDAEVVDELGQRAEAWRALDVVALHEVVIPRVLGDAVSEMAFSKDELEVVRQVRAGPWDVGVLLRPLRAPQIVDVARSGERMPQKASYFWPKVVTGLVLRSLE